MAKRIGHVPTYRVYQKHTDTCFQIFVILLKPHKCMHMHACSMGIQIRFTTITGFGPVGQCLVTELRLRCYMLEIGSRRL